MAFREDIRALADIPNVGPATVGYLRSVGVHTPFELVGQDPYGMFDELCQVLAKQFDPCLLDVFISAVKFMEGAPPKAWYHYTAERKVQLAKRKQKEGTQAASKNNSHGLNMVKPARIEE